MEHALVIGGSVAGLCAARALSDFFEKVTVLERDAYPKDAADRPGVPHGRLFHWLLRRGLFELEVLFQPAAYLYRQILHLCLFESLVPRHDTISSWQNTWKHVEASPICWDSGDSPAFDAGKFDRGSDDDGANNAQIAPR